MSNMTYKKAMDTPEKHLVWLHGEVKTPPFSKPARLEAGYLLRALQKREMLSLPHSRPMPNIGVRCHELRINDRGQTWRIIYRIDEDAVVIFDVFLKNSHRLQKGSFKHAKGESKSTILSHMEAEHGYSKEKAFSEKRLDRW